MKEAWHDRRTRNVPAERSAPRAALHLAAPAVKKGGRASKVFGALVLLALLGGLGLGTWRYVTLRNQTLGDAQEKRDFRPRRSRCHHRAELEKIIVSLPATTQAFTTANIFARASATISKRVADIGDSLQNRRPLGRNYRPRARSSDCAGAGNALQTEAAVNQAQANLELARVTRGHATVRS